MEFSLRIEVLSLLTSKVEKFHEYSKSAQKKKKRKAQFLKEATKIKATLIQNVKTH